VFPGWPSCYCFAGRRADRAYPRSPRTARNGAMCLNLGIPGPWPQTARAFSAKSFGRARHRRHSRSKWAGSRTVSGRRWSGSMSSTSAALRSLFVVRRKRQGIATSRGRRQDYAPRLRSVEALPQVVVSDRMAPRFNCSSSCSYSSQTISGPARLFN